MSISPKQAHHFVGEVLNLADENDYLRLHPRSVDSGWYVVLPHVKLSMVLDGNIAERSNSVQAKITKDGYTGWRFLLSNRTTISLSGAVEPQSFDYTDDGLEKTSVFSGSVAPGCISLRSIYRIAWDRRSREVDAYRYHIVHTEGESTNVTSDLPIMHEESFLYELDYGVLNWGDLSILKEEIAQHIDQVRMLKATDYR